MLIFLAIIVSPIGWLDKPHCTRIQIIFLQIFLSPVKISWGKMVADKLFFVLLSRPSSTNRRNFMSVMTNATHRDKLIVEAHIVQPGGQYQCCMLIPSGLLGFGIYEIVAGTSRSYPAYLTQTGHLAVGITAITAGVLACCAVAAFIGKRERECCWHRSCCWYNR